MIVPKLGLTTRPNSQASASILLSTLVRVLIFGTWQEQFPTDIEVCTVQLSGRENRLSEPLFTEINPEFRSWHKFASYRPPSLFRVTAWVP
jgi:hypothetical protein